jgi:hypothetical protein
MGNGTRKERQGLQPFKKEKEGRGHIHVFQKPFLKKKKNIGVFPKEGGKFWLYKEFGEK